MVRLICALTLVLLIASPSLGRQSLVGTYKMVSNVLNIDGMLTENMGKAPNGYLVATPTRIVVFFTAENRNFGTSVADKATLFDTLTAWSGVYRIEGKKLIIRVDASRVEQWNGTDQTRNWELSGNRLAITADPFPFPRDPSKKVIPQQVWEKVE
jgi:hypothetical protein